MKRAVVLLSGGMDSATILALAKTQNYECHALSFRYGQRHSAELNAAKQIAKNMSASSHRVIDLDLASIGGSALTDTNIPVPEQSAEGIPVTYVPARNTMFLSIALACAEVLDAQDIFIGVNAVDYSGYPDCRPEYIEAFTVMANLATKAAVEGKTLTIHTPLISLSKAEIILRGHQLGVDYAATVTCYQSDEGGRACGRCDACRLRAAGFKAAAVPDSTRYQRLK